MILLFDIFLLSFDSFIRKNRIVKYIYNFIKSVYWLEMQ